MSFEFVPECLFLPYPVIVFILLANEWNGLWVTGIRLVHCFEESSLVITHLTTLRNCSLHGHNLWLVSWIDVSILLFRAIDFWAYLHSDRYCFWTLWLCVTLMFCTCYLYVSKAENLGMNSFEMNQLGDWPHLIPWDYTFMFISIKITLIMHGTVRGGGLEALAVILPIRLWQRYVSWFLSFVT